MNQVDLRPFLDNPGALPKSTAILREPGLRALLLHLKPGEQIPEHQTRGAITVHCLAGQVDFSAGDETVALTTGILISVGPSRPHSLIAREESLLLVTVSEPAAAQS